MARAPRAARHEVDSEERRAWAEEVTNLGKEVDRHNRQIRKAARAAAARAAAAPPSRRPKCSEVSYISPTYLAHAYRINRSRLTI